MKKLNGKLLPRTKNRFVQNIQNKSFDKTLLKMMKPLKIGPCMKVNENTRSF